MADLDTRLRLLAERGTHVGSTEMIERVERRLSGQPLVVAGQQRKGFLMTKTQERTETELPARTRNLRWAAVTFLAVLASGGLLFALSGVAFEDALVLSISGLSTTGPLLTVATDAPIELATLGPFAKSVFCAAMVLGRLETLAIIALFTPDLWRS